MRPARPGARGVVTVAGSPCLRAALAYLRRGWSVVPCGSAKRPLLPWAPYQAHRATEAEVRQWWTRWPQAAVAIVTGVVSGIVVVDLDRGHADGADGLASIRAAGLDLPATRCVRTPSGGTHAYYLHPGRTVPNAARLRGLAGVDMRGDGGYALAPPSRTADGGYAAVPETRDLPIAPLPAWVLEGRDHGGAPARTADEWAPVWTDPCPEGRRNATCARLAGHLAAHGIGQMEAEALLLRWAADRCDPPMAPAEVSRTVASIYRAHGRHVEPLPDPAPMPEAEQVWDAMEPRLRARLASRDGRVRAGGLADALRTGMAPEVAHAIALDLSDGDAEEAGRALRWAMRAAREERGRHAG